MADKINYSALLQELNVEKISLFKQMEAVHESIETAKTFSLYEAAENRWDKLSSKAEILENKIHQTRSAIYKESGAKGKETKALKKGLTEQINEFITQSQIRKGRKPAAEASRPGKATERDAYRTNEQIDATRINEDINTKAAMDAYEEAELAKNAEPFKQRAAQTYDKSASIQKDDYVRGKMRELRAREPGLQESYYESKRLDFMQEAGTKFGLPESRTYDYDKPSAAKTSAPKSKLRGAIPRTIAGFGAPLVGGIALKEAGYDDVGLTELGALGATGYGASQVMKHGTGAFKRPGNIASGLTLAGMGLYDGEIDATDLGIAGATGIVGAGIQSTINNLKDDPETGMQRYDQGITQVDDKGRVVDWKNKVSGATSTIPTEQELVAKRLEEIRKGPRATTASKVRMNKPLALAAGASGLAALGAREEIMDAADWMKNKGEEYNFIPGAKYMQEAGEFLNGLGIFPGGLTGVLTATLASKYGMDKVRSMYNYNPEIPGGMSKSQATSKFIADIKQAVGNKFNQYKDELVGFKQDAFTSAEQKQNNRIIRESRQKVRDLQRAQRFTDPAQTANIARNERIAQGLDPDGMTGGQSIDYDDPNYVKGTTTLEETNAYDRPVDTRDYAFGEQGDSRRINEPRIVITPRHSPMQKERIIKLENANKDLASSLNQFKSTAPEYQSTMEQIKNNIDLLNKERVGDVASDISTKGEKINEFWDTKRAGKINTVDELLTNKLDAYHNILNNASSSVQKGISKTLGSLIAGGATVEEAFEKAFGKSKGRVKQNFESVLTSANEVKTRLGASIAQGAQVIDEGIQGAKETVAPEKKSATRQAYETLKGKIPFVGKSETPGPMEFEPEPDVVPNTTDTDKQPGKIRKAAGGLARGSLAIGKYGLSPQALWSAGDVIRGAYDADDAGEYLQETGSDIVDQMKLAGRDYMSMYDQGEYGAMLGKATDEMLMQPLEGSAKIMYNLGAMGANYLADDQEMLPIMDLERRGFETLNSEGQYGDKWNEQDFHASELSDEAKAAMAKPTPPGVETSDKPKPPQQPVDPYAKYNESAKQYGVKFQGFYGNTPVFMGPDGTKSDTASGAVYQRGPDTQVREQQRNQRKQQEQEQARWNTMTPQQQMQIQKTQYDMRNAEQDRRIAQYDKEDADFLTEIEGNIGENSKAYEQRALMNANLGRASPAQQAVMYARSQAEETDNQWAVPFVGSKIDPYLPAGTPNNEGQYNINPTSIFTDAGGSDNIQRRRAMQNQARANNGFVPEYYK